MFSFLLFYIFLPLAFLGILIWFLYRRYRNFSNDISQELSKHHFELISIKPVPLFSKNPFPNEIFSYGVETSVLGISGEEVFNRIIEFQDSQNRKYKMRIMLYTVAFKLKKIRWEKELDNLS